jgi:hypothetical protein
MRITEIFRTFGPEYLSRYPDMPLQHKKAFAAMINCRSGAFGATVYRLRRLRQKAFHRSVVREPPLSAMSVS